MPLHGCRYNGVVYDRKFDPEAEEPWPHKHELWMVEVLVALFSGDDKIPIFFPHDPTPPDAPVIRLIGCAKFGKKQATWKELVFRPHRHLLHIFNLMSHGRRMYRSLSFASDSRFALHGFSPNTAPRKKGLPPHLRLAVGSSKLLRQIDRSLVITRKNDAVGGIESYVPPRLLQGLIPSALLESFRFWEGADGLLRGEPLDRSNLWFSYNCEVQLQRGTADDSDWVATVTRKPQGVGHRRIHGVDMRLADAGADDAAQPQTGKADKVVVVSEELVGQLCSMGFGPSMARLALKRNSLDVGMAAQYLLDEANGEEMIFYESKVDIMEQAGFPRLVVEHVLDQFSGDRDVAMAWLVEPDNAAEVARLYAAYGIAAEGGEAATAMEVVAATEDAAAMAVDDDVAHDTAAEPMSPPGSPTAAAASSSSGGGEQDLVLLSLLDAPKGSLLDRLAALLTRIEDLSHILVWASLASPSSEPGMMEVASSSVVTIKLIELPRLKLRMAPREDTAAGVVRLHVLDHSGWFVTDVDQGEKRLHDLLQGLENSLLLENGARDLQVGHRVPAPPISGRFQPI